MIQILDSKSSRKSSGQPSVLTRRLDGEGDDDDSDVCSCGLLPSALGRFSSADGRGGLADSGGG